MSGGQAHSHNIYQQLAQPAELNIQRQVYDGLDRNQQIFIPTLCGFVRQKLTFFLQEPINSFKNGHTTVNRSKTYQELSSNTITSWLQCLDCVGMFYKELSGKRNLKFYGLVQEVESGTGTVLGLIQQVVGGITTE